MSAEPATYTPARADHQAHRDTLLSLWDGSLGDSERMRAKFDWFYDACPNGSPLVELLRHEPTGKWVGSCSAGRRHMCFEGREVKSAVLVDLVVAPEHRSLGPALMMQMSIVEHVRNDLDLLLGFPNPRAASLFKRVRYSKFNDIVRYVRILRHRPYLERRMPQWAAVACGWLLDGATRIRDALRGSLAGASRTEWSARVDPRMEALWERSRPRAMLTARRDASFLRWRFDECPLASSRHLLVSDSRSGELLAWFTTVREQHLLHVKDFWSVDAEAGVPTRCLDALLRAARADGAGAVSVEMATTPARRANWLSRGFVARNARPVFGYWSRPPNTVDGDIDVHLTAADEDE